MKFKDLVANSLPRVRGRKSKKAAHLHSSNQVPSKQEGEFSTHAPYFMQHQHPVFESRESSVERSSTVAVVDAPWREGAMYPSKSDRSRPLPCDNMGIVTQPMTYYKPGPLAHHQQHGMVVSHSADGISTQAMLLASSRDCITGSKVTSHADRFAITGYQHPNMAATSETTINYVGPNYLYHSQHQHQHQHQHHHHHHSHDYHYVYHHHHHDRQPYHHQPLKPDPLTERNCHQVQNTASAKPNHNQLATEKPQKSESGGFLRKSFASFRAMRKQGGRNKEKDGRANSLQDENEKCLVCPYPQPQVVDKNGSLKKQTKQSKKELKSLIKSKKNKHNSTMHDNKSDASWCSDNDAKVYHQSHHLQGFETVPYTTMNSFPVRECSMESSISRHTVAGSRERMDQQYNFDTASLSGYDSDVTKNRTGRSRSRIKTNPWLPSPQPSLTMGRRIENRQARDNNDDVMEDEISSCFPRSASFDYHGQLSMSSFLSSSGQNEQKRNIQRHRSLTPVDLKLNLSLPRTKKSESPKSFEPKSHLNDLNTNSTKSRPNSILSPNSEFVALADNIEQLANNISFEYEDSFDTSLEGTATPRDTTLSGNRRTVDETMSKKRKSDSSPPIPNDNVSVSDNAYSPDSGIGCLGSCDGDDSMTLGNTVVLEQSPTVSIPSSQSTKSNSSNSTPKRKNSKSICNVNDTKVKAQQALILTHESQCVSGNNESKQDLVSDHNTRLLGSSSSESIASVVVSESDIDNTSYKFVESCNLTNDSSMMSMDPHKPQNVTPYLMVDERLDINFRSLPRKLNGKPAKKRAENNGSYTITRTKNVIIENERSPSMVLFPNDESKPYSFSLAPVTKPIITNSNHFSQGPHSLYDGDENVGEIELKYDQIDGRGEFEMAVNFVDLGMSTFKTEETGDSVAMDTVDACVQTDFLLDFDTLERKQPSGLSPLDDSFDPVESTRRWLISGNMQGSADTGYSSQPRDSHVFMEEEATFLQLETFSDTDAHNVNQKQFVKPKTISNSSASCRGKSSIRDAESSSPCDCSNFCSCTTNPTTTSHKPNSLSHSLPHNQDELDRNESHFLECDLSKLLFGLKPPCEDDVEDVCNGEDTSKAFSRMNNRHNDERRLSVSDVNKRHSSDSSTSTLTSDVVVLGDKDNDVNYGHCNGASFVSPPPGPTMSQNCTKYNDKSPDDDYHDYVNLPVRFFGAKNKSKVSIPHENKIKYHISNEIFVDKNLHDRHKYNECASTQKYYPSSTKDSHLGREAPNKNSSKDKGHVNKSFGCLEEGSYLHEEDRPDYLEFLRDAPLQNPQSTMNQLFVVPGFGPVDFPAGILYPDCKENVNCFNYPNVGLEERKSVTPKCDKSSNRSKTPKSTKSKKEERPTNLKLMSYNCCASNGSNESSRGFTSLEPTKKDTKSQSVSSNNSKRKPYKDTANKSERCPTVRSYDVDDFAPINRVDLTSSSASFSSSTSANRQDNKSGSTRNLAERVSQLRREKEIIYRKIQEVQHQQELHRHREQFQHHRSLHSQRKEELLETLRVLKDKLEEQSRKLNIKGREEM